MRSAYLAHLEIDHFHEPNLDLLRRLQRAHVQTIPYENLDMLAGQLVSLEPVQLFEKIIVERRGGYCFELNSLFGWLLRDLGFDTEFRMGRVWLRDPEDVPPRNHGSHIVRLNGRRFIADVGFGGRAPRVPLDIDLFDTVIEDGDATGEPLRIVHADEFGLMVQRRIAGTWSNQFSLEPIPAHASDLEVANFYQACAPTSHFRSHLFVGRFRESGRDGLFDTRLSRRRGTETSIELIENIERLCEVLQDVFEIDPAPHRKVLTTVLENSQCD